MNKKVKVVIYSAIILVSSSMGVLAATVENPINAKYGDLTGIIESSMDWVRVIAVIMLLAYITYGGYTKLTAAGDPEKEQKSAKIITMSVVGFIIIMIAPFIVRTIGAIFGVATV